jgi:hypothetical protein
LDALSIVKVEGNSGIIFIVVDDKYNAIKLGGNEIIDEINVCDISKMVRVEGKLGNTDIAVFEISNNNKFVGNKGILVSAEDAKYNSKIVLGNDGKDEIVVPDISNTFNVLGILIVVILVLEISNSSKFGGRLGRVFIGVPPICSLLRTSGNIGRLFIVESII